MTTQSTTDDGATDNLLATKPSRPGWVWVIAIFYCLSAGWTLFSYWLIFSRSIPVTAEQDAYFSNLNLWDHLLSAGIATLNLTGAALLFLLRRWAVYFFGAATAAGLIVAIVHAITTANRQGHGTT